MAIEAPKIDERDKRNIIAELRSLVVSYCPEEWADIEAVSTDAQADTLIQIFSRMMELVIERLNRAPEKNFLAFLDMLGMRLLPPRPARAPLTFTLAEGTSQFVHVPERTQVAAAESPDNEPVVFETEKSLTVILPKLVRAVSICPDDDRWTDHSKVFFGEESGLETLFEGKDLLPHRLYLGHKDLFGFKEPVDITLSITLSEESGSDPGGSVDTHPNITGTTNIPFIFRRPSRRWLDPRLLKKAFVIQRPVISGPKEPKGPEKPEIPIKVKWYHYTEDSPEPVPLSVDDENDPKVNLRKSGDVTFKNVSAVAEKTLAGTGLTEGRTNNWIFAELKTPASRAPRLPEIRSIKASVEIVKEEKTLPADLAFFNNFLIDLTKDFWPFGERPKFNDTFYVGSKEVFSKKDAKITLNVALTPDKKGITTGITLKWEFRDGGKWHLLGKTNQKGETTESAYSFKDDTKAFTVSGEITFTCPHIEATEINGEESHWIRVRIVAGGYGEEAKYEERNIGDTEETGSFFVPPTFEPPSIEKLTLSYSFGDTQVLLEDILTYNDFIYKDQTSGSPPGLLEGKPFSPFKGKPSGPFKSKPFTFSPFEKVEDTEPGLYLAFDRDISTLPVTLFFPLVSRGFIPQPEDKETKPPVLGWEYWNGSRWIELNVEDSTAELTAREMLQFQAPENLKKRSSFGDELYWIRVVLRQGSYGAKPLTGGIHANTVWANNIITIKDEILGSGTGALNQVFNLAHYPVLSSSGILVHEADLTKEDREIILGQQGEESIVEVKDEAGGVAETWVLWQEVEHFYFSGPHSRHYVIDHNRGTVTFGDNVKGMVPPAGKDNIKCIEYRYGGGTRGNMLEDTVTKLRTTIPYVDAVINPTASAGGVNKEDFERLKIRAPHTIKHRNRAVTAEDYEWIITEASPRVARVKSLSTTGLAKQFKPGWVTIIIVPDSDEAKPLPSEELLGETRRYLTERATSYLTTMVPAQQINLIPPSYLRVDVEATVDIPSLGDAKIVKANIIERLREFFHPMHGGPLGNGWPFGRDVYITEVYEAIEGIPGVNYVEKVFLKGSVQIYKMILSKDITSPYSFPERSRVTFRGKITMLLAEGVTRERPFDSLNVVGFKEGDTVELWHDKVDEKDKEKTIRINMFLIVKSVCLDDSGKKCILECEPARAEYDFPAQRSFIETSFRPEDLKVRSFLVDEIKADFAHEITKLHVAIPGSGDGFVLSHRDWPSNTASGRIKELKDEPETIYLEDDYLLYPGTITIWNTGEKGTEQVTGVKSRRRKAGLKKTDNPPGM